ncbi:MAG: hypothetical protein RLZZ584_4032, partial [Pseudomonadota bacterium]
MARRIAFVDTRVAEISAQLEALDQSIDVIAIQADRCGLQQIDDHLARHGDIASIDLFCHGRPGRLLMGQGELDIATLRAAAPRKSAPPQAMLVYGCEAAAGVRGDEFMAGLSNYFDAPVAGATRRIGGPAAEANWQLDAVHGQLPATHAVHLPAYGGWLATVIGGAGDDLLAGTAGNDSIDGGAGDDTIIASMGLDTLVGGLGTDTLLVDLDYTGAALGSALHYYLGSNAFLTDVDSTSSYATIASKLPTTATYFNIWSSNG